MIGKIEILQFDEILCFKILITVISVLSSIASSDRSSFNRLHGDGFHVIRQTQPSTEIDKCGSDVDLIVAEFGGFIVPWEHMVVIVPPLTECHYGYAFIFGRTNISEIYKVMLWTIYKFPVITLEIYTTPFNSI